MKFKDFALTAGNHFVAMQYYGLILNRTYLIILTEDLLIGIKVNGMVSIEVNNNMVFVSRSNRAIAKVVNKMAIKGDLQNPYSYVKSKYIDKVRECDLSDGSILAQNKSNFVIHRADIADVYYDPKKKWGMGYYPHDGKVYVKTRDGKKREFIILGNQDGSQIAALIRAK